MITDETAPADVRDIALDVAEIWPDYQPTSLIELPALARLARVRRVLAKMEGERPLGNFKVLGGMVAALRALARVAGVTRLRDLRREVSLARSLGPPTLVCASAGNHGLAVAAAARWAGTRATVYLAESANRARAARIEALGARVVWTPGTYDDAVAHASRDEGLLIADTSASSDDPVVRDVMAGYSLIARELAVSLGGGAAVRPTHLFVQAGVGGLAAALAEGSPAFMGAARRIIVVEPASAACVAAALAAGAPVRVAGDLHTGAEMLACGLASAPAVRALREHSAASVLVDEELLQQAVRQLHDAEGVATTASGATGLAGLLLVSASDELRELHQLSEESCVLLVITEGPAPSTATILGTS